jgi:DNA-binding PadR family transcriptional regulator
MALAHAILSALVCAPCSGYDLAKRFDPTTEGSVGFFWGASFQQIYRELSRLEEKGWLKAEKIQQESRPDKRLYSVTDLGIQQLQQWIAATEEANAVKDDLLVKLYAGHLVHRDLILAKLEAHRQSHQQRLAIYREIEAKFFHTPDELSDVLTFNYITLLKGIHYEQSWLSWCAQAIALLSNG